MFQLLSPIPTPQYKSGQGIFSPHPLSQFENSVELCPPIHISHSQFPVNDWTTTTVIRRGWRFVVLNEQQGRSRSLFTSPAAFKQTACLQVWAESCRAWLQKLDIDPLNKCFPGSCRKNNKCTFLKKKKCAFYYFSLKKWNWPLT